MRGVRTVLPGTDRFKEIQLWYHTHARLEEFVYYDAEEHGERYDKIEPWQTSNTLKELFYNNLYNEKPICKGGELWQVIMAETKDPSLQEECLNYIREHNIKVY